MKIINCKNCNREIEHHAKQMCITCYKKLSWKPKKIVCKRCERERVMHAKGLCTGCYNSVFHIDKVKEQNRKRYYNLDTETYRKATKECAICGFDSVVDLHHIDRNHKNNSDKNLIGLCPNHHRMIHDRVFRNDICKILANKGYTVPEGYKDDEFFKNS